MSLKIEDRPRVEVSHGMGKGDHLRMHEYAGRGVNEFPGAVVVDGKPLMKERIWSRSEMAYERRFNNKMANPSKGNIHVDDASKARNGRRRRS